jgi:hypothetical protein
MSEEKVLSNRLNERVSVAEPGKRICVTVKSDDLRRLHFKYNTIIPILIKFSQQ